MHSIQFKGPNGLKGVIHHNGDWSGDAEVTWGPADSDYGWSTVRIPGWLARAMLPRDVPAPAAEPVARPTTIREWCAAAYEQSARSGFHDGEHALTARERITTYLINLHGEVSEAWEAFRAGDLAAPCDKAERMAAMGLRPLTCLEEELADIAIRCFDTAQSFGLDLQSSIEVKHAYNGTRARKHGGKLA